MRTRLFKLILIIFDIRCVINNIGGKKILDNVFSLLKEKKSKSKFLCSVIISLKCEDEIRFFFPPKYPRNQSFNNPVDPL